MVVRRVGLKGVICSRVYSVSVGSVLGAILDYCRLSGAHHDLVL